MPGQAPLRRRILARPARAVLGALMSAAVIVAERRIRKALARDTPVRSEK